MKKMILIGGGAIVLLGGTVAGTLFFTGMLGDKVSANASLAAGSVPLAAAALPSETFYYHLQPEFVVNMLGSSRKKFLMVEMSVATHDEEHLDLLEMHSPELRNELLIVLGRQDAETLSTEEGRLELRVAARAAIDTLLAKHNRPTPVADVFMTRFVMQ